MQQKATAEIISYDFLLDNGLLSLKKFDNSILLSRFNYEERQILAVLVFSEADRQSHK